MGILRWMLVVLLGTLLWVGLFFLGGAATSRYTIFHRPYWIQTGRQLADVEELYPFFDAGFRHQFPHIEDTTPFRELILILRPTMESLAENYASEYFDFFNGEVPYPSYERIMTATQFDRESLSALLSSGVSAGAAAGNEELAFIASLPEPEQQMWYGAVVEMAELSLLMEAVGADAFMMQATTMNPEMMDVIRMYQQEFQHYNSLSARLFMVSVMSALILSVLILLVRRREPLRGARAIGISTILFGVPVLGLFGVAFFLQEQFLVAFFQMARENNPALTAAMGEQALRGLFTWFLPIVAGVLHPLGIVAIGSLAVGVILVVSSLVFGGRTIESRV